MPVPYPGPPTVNAQLTSVLVTVLPVDHEHAEDFGITVEWRGGDRWAVCRRKHCLGHDGIWEAELQPSSRDDAWLATHRYSYDAAMALAARHAPGVKVNGVTAADLARKIATEASDV